MAYREAGTESSLEVACLSLNFRLCSCFVTQVSVDLGKSDLSKVQCLMPIIPATWEAEIWRIVF
jgi:hypothetical protein